VAELTTLLVTNTASDGDIPSRPLAYSLLNPPTGAAIDTGGVISWTPSEAQGPGTNVITTVGDRRWHAGPERYQQLYVVVQEVNSPPILPAQTNRTVSGLASLVVTNMAPDTDIPANPLTYVLQTGPSNAVIDASGIITWTPVVAQVPSTNVFTTVVTDYNRGRSTRPISARPIASQWWSIRFTTDRLCPAE